MEMTCSNSNTPEGELPIWDQVPTGYSIHTESEVLEVAVPSGGSHDNTAEPAGTLWSSSKNSVPIVSEGVLSTSGELWTVVMK
jgi:hypothetical protein